MRKREEQYRALAQTVPVGVWQVSEMGETQFANPRFSPTSASTPTRWPTPISPQCSVA